MIKQPSGSINTEPSLTKWTIYLINALANMLVNFDHGIVPAATKEIKSDLNLDNIQLGLLGSVVYCGLLVGSLAAS